MSEQPAGAAYQIEVVNRQRRVRIDRGELERVARHVLDAEQVARAALEIVIANDQAIRGVHRQFMGLDSPTDVLTFPLHEPGEPLAGSIIVSAETAAREGPRHGLDARAELLLYLIHAILHLCGYDDLKPSDARRMRRRQTQLLRQFMSRSLG